MKLDIPSGDFAGYIFDCDGTLVDTMPLHYRAWDRAMQRAGLLETLNEELFLEMQAEMKVIQPVVDFARKFHGKAPMSVASGGPKPVVVKTLELMHLSDLFPVVVTPEDVTHGKPSPEMFLLAAKKMGVAPERCLVFEDAGPGFEAAIAAGMQYVRVSSRVV